MKEPCSTIYDGWITNETGVDQVIEAAREITPTEQHLGFLHLPIKKGEEPPQDSNLEKHREIGRLAAMNGEPCPF
jgi:hypothetical protein